MPVVANEDVTVGGTNYDVVMSIPSRLGDRISVAVGAGQLALRTRGDRSDGNGTAYEKDWPDAHGCRSVSIACLDVK